MHKYCTNFPRVNSFFKTLYEVTASTIKIFLLNSGTTKDTYIKKIRRHQVDLKDSRVLPTHIFQNLNKNIILFNGPTDSLYLHIEIIIMIECSRLDKS